MKLIASAAALAAACSVGLAAQTQEQTTKSKITVKEGKEMTVTGCVQRTASDAGFMLTDAADKDGRVHSYMLVSDDVDLAKHVGHRVEIKGKATDRGDAKIKTESETKTKVEHGDDKETHGKAELKGDLSGLPFLGVKDVKMIAPVCP
jgi:azurin